MTASLLTSQKLKLARVSSVHCCHPDAVRALPRGKGQLEKTGKAGPLPAQQTLLFWPQIISGRFCFEETDASFPWP